MSNLIFHGQWHHKIWFDDRNKKITDMSALLSKALEKLNLKKKDISLVGIGTSGACSVPVIARHARVPFAIIRKAAEPTKSLNCPIVGETREQVIFIDDLIDTGKTIRRVKRVLSFEGVALVGAIMMRSYREKETIDKKRKEYVEYNIEKNFSIPLWIAKGK